VLADEVSSTPRLDTMRDVTHGTEEVGPKATGRIGPRPLEQSPCPQAFDEDVLDCIVQILEMRRTAPSRRQIGANDNRIPRRKLGPRRLSAGSGLAEQGPASGIARPHESLMS
jgi:hypothetical protein